MGENSEKDYAGFKTILKNAVAAGASDIHLTTGWYPMFRLHGLLEKADENTLSHKFMENIALRLMNDRQKTLFEKERTLDMGYSLESKRYRINCYFERGKIAIAIRHLDEKFQTLEGLHLPPQLAELAHLNHGLVLVSGATGSGKSTTLAALINEINITRNCHIITIEDPIEFIHDHHMSLIHQRELHTDVTDFSSAVRASLREDPDVLLVGEMRDVETMRAALTAAETGHLVFSTLHTGSAVGVVERMIGTFPADEQVIARHRLAMVLKAVVAQQLLPTMNGKGRIPAVEILRVTKAVANLIESDKSRQIHSAMESGQAEGMQTLEQSLVALVREKWIDRQMARARARDPENIDKLLRSYF
ncbi:MAG: PilT/PilU family type 4a pilus ATPase [Emcibacter sp.]|nr:PilT/PilU family type 4a pilus ATPase [Emcibacter sp.]